MKREIGKKIGNRKSLIVILIILLGNFLFAGLIDFYKKEKRDGLLKY